jgi:hypothetical protein
MRGIGRKFRDPVQAQLARKAALAGRMNTLKSRGYLVTAENRNDFKEVCALLAIIWPLGFDGTALSLCNTARWMERLE